MRVIAGDVAGHSGPGSTHTPISLVHATVQPGAELVLPWPSEFNALVYALSGRGTIGPEARPFRTGQLAVHGAGDALVLRADADAGDRATRGSTCWSSAGGPSASPSSPTVPSS